MALLTREQAAEWPDPLVRDPLLAGADLNHFCAPCLGVATTESEPDHLACAGDSGHGRVACQCRCPSAMMTRWDRDENTEFDLGVMLAGQP